MSLVAQIEALATRIANYLRDLVLPRLLPTGGTTGQALVKSGPADFAASWGATSGISVATGSIVTKNSNGEITTANPSATPTSLVIAQLQPNADFDADDLQEYSVSATPTAGSIVFTITNNGPVVGDFRIAYQLS
jgi:hypothetical protein